ncbi:hypothetical protein BD309DRAFT_951380 [Dichomitus squalens]|uniref:Uncharacterized protein n=1 Tax=Dichomitus squalens TaxID=114155 RepID=A0A4Q9N4B7_9APHY|nr:hypothetical protein BD311DRAFT_748153 [Dichomitus squalens]TBU47638.1 hypothetical protein BD309DRAFT_951380 [Dichomitus squalens]TBU56869.1 hypothetical protein BD310DRAFT_596063 [Dichomitus squalens]
MGGRCLIARWHCMPAAPSTNRLGGFPGHWAYWGAPPACMPLQSASTFTQAVIYLAVIMAISPLPWSLLELQAEELTSSWKNSSETFTIDTIHCHSASSPPRGYSGGVVEIVQRAMVLETVSKGFAQS